MRLLLNAFLALILSVGLASAAEVSGRVSLEMTDLALADVGPTVVYLTPVGAPSPSIQSPAAIEIKQERAKFSPDFAIVSVGQSIAMPNFDGIFHNVFSFSRPNDFDLGLYESGETKSVSFDQPGVVRIYCSIHESMSALVFVAPTPAWAIVDIAGSYSISDVPPGDYELTVWNERLPSATRTVLVGETTRLVVDVALETNVH